MTDKGKYVVGWLALGVTLLVNWTLIIVYVERMRADNRVQDVMIASLVDDVRQIKQKIAE